MTKDQCYKSLLNLSDTQKAIFIIRDVFAKSLSNNLHLEKVAAPLFVEESTGLNDDLDGLVRCVKFDTRGGQNCSVVQSLAKWKRYILSKFGCGSESGIYAELMAIRRDEECSPLHSYLVDQWDWEMVISKTDRTMEKFKSVVKTIYKSFQEVEDKIVEAFPVLPKVLPKEITFVSSQELEDQYPQLTPNQREYECSKKHGAICITQIGKVLESGAIHDVRAPDYDDWELNGDIIFYYEPLDVPFELSSMGIRVSEESLMSQLKHVKAEHRQHLMFHSMLLSGKLPYTVGGGIGQSRAAMFFLKKLHIGEIQFSVWNEKIVSECKSKGIELL